MGFFGGGTDHASSIAVRLFPVASTLGIGEGIETALAAHQITHCNTWAALNTAFLKKFMAPSGVRNLIIFADADKNAAGHAAAFECAYKNLMSTHNDVQSVSVRWPERGDFNDVITDGLQVYEWVFEKTGR
ncbi:toprim domain-containing protein [Enterobacter mori]|nr:toprim domain-containing protein [Enterobacter mori]EME8859696.1 toprim domain-containing protein [Enterobacter mori]